MCPVLLDMSSSTRPWTLLGTGNAASLVSGNPLCYIQFLHGLVFSENFNELLLFALKGTVSPEFLLQVILMNNIPSSPLRNNIGFILNFSKIRGDIQKFKVHHR
jgi:hypothetical protein